MRCAVLTSLALLTACGGTPNPNRLPTASRSAPKIGQPYKVFGKTYYPADDRDYDEKGYASWYGPGFHNGTTANGEPYDMDGLTAAHKTLPLPSFVEVTNLDNDRKLTVRINDRGPFVEGRIIDLSRRAAQLLGTDRKGVAKVRVKRVFPSDREIAELRLGGPRSLRPERSANPIPAGYAGGSGPVYLQVAAVSDRGRAYWLAGYLESFGKTSVESAPGGLFRVRMGPYENSEEAAATLAKIQAAGYQEARIVAAVR
jgi:rare lipoprotein A